MQRVPRFLGLLRRSIGLLALPTITLNLDLLESVNVGFVIGPLDGSVASFRHGSSLVVLLLVFPSPYDTNGGVAIPCKFRKNTSTQCNSRGFGE